jgi:hypothetical protein
MVTTRSKFHRWQARVLRWTSALSVLALVGCALPRRDAPPTLFSAATPVDFPADVRFLSTDPDQFAEKYRMSVQSTYLPFDYPKYNSADFRVSTMPPLFEYGARCARSGRLWTTIDETMDTVAAATPASNRTPTVDQEVECPLRDVQLTAGDRR